MEKRLGPHSLLAVIIVTILATATPPLSASAAEQTDSSIEKLDTAINFVPADAAFYGSMLRGREQLEAVASSRAWKQLMEIPLVQMGLQFYKLQAADEQSAAGKVDKVLNDPQVQELLAMLADMASEEVFIYAADDIIDTCELFGQLNNINRFAPIMQHLDEGNDDLDPQQARAKMLLALLARNVDSLKVPNLIFGFKITDKQRAAAQLGKLDIIAGITLAQHPDFSGVYKRVKLGDDSFSTFTLSGEMIPWDELPLDRLGNIETSPGDLQKVVEQVKKQQLVVTIGLRGDYLLLAVGPSTAAIANLGKGELLVNRPEIKRLDRFADKPLMGIGYASKRLNRCIAGSGEDIDELLAVVDEILPHSGLDTDDQQQIRRDAAALAEDIKPLLPQLGAVSSVGFSSERGLEQYRFDWGRYPLTDASKPLGILRHVGGSPLLAVVSRCKVAPENYDLLCKWLRTAYGYFEKFALPQMEQSDREKFDELAASMAPLLARLDRINRQNLLPAIADGQSGVVVDARLMSRQIHQAVPAADEPMPMIEPAVVIGVSNEGSFREAVIQYGKLVGDTAAALHKTLPDRPELQMPKVKVQKTDVGEIYSIELPEQAGFDKQVGLYLGLNQAVAVFCFNESQTKRLLSETRLNVGGVLGDVERPRAMAVVFSWPATLKAAVPWVKLALKQAALRFMGEEEIDAQLSIIQPQISALVEVLCCIREITSESYYQQGTLVTHTLIEISDIR